MPRQGRHTRVAAAILALATAMSHRPVAQAQSPVAVPAGARLLAEAARASAAGVHDDAARLYEAAAADGARDPGVYFNLANAWLAAGEPGRAAVNYARAAAGAPRDADIRHNRAWLRAQLPPELAGTPVAGWRAWVDAVRGWAAPVDLGRVALAGWWVLAAAMITRRRASRRVRRLTRLAEALALVLVGAAGLTAVAMRVDARTRPAAFVVSPAAEVSDGPGPPEELRAVAELPAGVEVRILERRGEWVRIVWPGSDAGGWLPAHAVERVEPSG